MGNLDTDVEIKPENTVSDPTADQLQCESPKLSSHESHESFEDDDDDFGSFDEASFEEFQAPERQSEIEIKNIQSVFGSSVFRDHQLFLSKLDDLLDSIIPGSPQKTNGEPAMLLKAEASEILEKLSKAPRLNPPNWIKLKIRRNLLIKLGVPINLDELESPNMVNVSNNSMSHNRKRSVNEQDIDWSNFTIPEFESFNVSAEKKQELLNKTNETLSRIEEDNLNNTSQLFLESSLEASLESKLAQMKANYQQLIELCSVWQDQMKELRNSQEVYESVVQNMVGYSQKLQRNEIIEHLQKTKGKKGRRTF